MRAPLQLVEIVTMQALNHGHKVLEHLFVSVFVAQPICKVLRLNEGVARWAARFDARSIPANASTRSSTAIGKKCSSVTTTLLRYTLRLDTCMCSMISGVLTVVQDAFDLLEDNYVPTMYRMRQNHHRNCSVVNTLHPTGATACSATDALSASM